MRRLLLTVILVFCATACFAQSPLPIEDRIIEMDVVYLKFGTTTQGFIIENVPGDHIIIVNNDGVKLTYTYDVIERMEKKKKKLMSLTWEHLTKLTKIVLKTGEIYEGTVVSKEPDGSCVLLTKDREIKQITGEEVVSIQDITPTITMAQYEKMKKSPFLAFIFDTIPGLALGHLYAGQWGQGLLFEGAICILIGAGVASSTDSMNVAIGKILIFGSAILIVDFIQGLNAATCVKKRNQRLLEMVKDTDVGLLYRQNEGVNEFGVSLKF